MHSRQAWPAQPRRGAPGAEGKDGAVVAASPTRPCHARRGGKSLLRPRTRPLAPGGGAAHGGAGTAREPAPSRWRPYRRITAAVTRGAAHRGGGRHANCRACDGGDIRAARRVAACSRTGCGGPRHHHRRLTDPVLPPAVRGGSVLVSAAVGATPGTLPDRSACG